MDADFAELLGMHAGDGTIYRVNSGTLVWELRGGIDEREFYDTYVAALVTRCGLDTFRIGARGRAYGIRSCTRSFIERILDAGFPIGSKSSTLAIPQAVLEGEETLKRAFLRGYVATDGSAYLARVNRNTTASYPVIELCSSSKRAIEQCRALLLELGIRSYFWMSTKPGRRSPRPGWTLRITGSRADAFVEKIRLSNPKHRPITFKGV